MKRLLALCHGIALATLFGNWLYLRRRSGRERAAESHSPSVSVLIPARNEAANLRRLVPSLLRQDYERFEVIVYDDGSADATPDVLAAYADDRLRVIRGGPLPEGWVGKVHALYQATREATGERFLFLDADTELLRRDSLRRLVRRHAALPRPAVLTALPRLRGRGMLLVSLVPNAILSGLPWFLGRWLRLPSLGAVNGQCWLIDADDYRRHEPHASLPDEVLEDVMIGRLLMRRGVVPHLVDVTDDVAVHMYGSFREAWGGFRKNAYLIMGGRPAPFLLFFAYFLLSYVVGPLRHPRFLLTLGLNKAVTDRLAGIAPRYSLLAPVAFALGSALQLDSAVSHWSGRVSWKGRRVGVRRALPAVPAEDART